MLLNVISSMIILNVWFGLSFLVLEIVNEVVIDSISLVRYSLFVCVVGLIVWWWMKVYRLFNIGIRLIVVWIMLSVDRGCDMGIFLG